MTNINDQVELIIYNKILEIIKSELIIGRNDKELNMYNNTEINNSFEDTLGALDSESKNQAELAYKQLKIIKENLQNSFYNLDNTLTQEQLDSLALQMQNLILKTDLTLLKISILLDNTIASNNLTQDTLLTKKTLIKNKSFNNCRELLNNHLKKVVTIDTINPLFLYYNK